MKKPLALLALWIATSVSAAPATQESVERLLAASRAESLMDSMYGHMEEMMRQGMKQASAGQSLGPEQQRMLDTMPARFVVLMREEMSWQKLKPLYVQLYRDTFEQEEIDGLLAFYAGPVGQAYLDKMPVVMQKSMALSQSLMESVLPRMMAAVKDAMAEAKAAK